MMLTRCPSCATAFRVSAEQLKVKQGRVRCGHCRQVFNALDTLVDEHEPAQAAIESPPPADQPPQIEEAAAIEPPSERELSAGGEPAPLSDYPASEAPAERPWPDYVDDTYAVPVFGRTRRGHYWLWGSAAFLAILLLSLQAVLHFRTELSLSFPEAKPLLRDGGSLFGLDLPLPRKPDLLGIETSDLHP